MNKDYLQLILTLNECDKIAIQAYKNASHMEKNLNPEYKDKLQRMGHELPHLIRRVNDLRQVLEEFNRIAMS